MPRQRQAQLNEATRARIKATARRLMAEKGTAGLSLRAIARDLDMTAPALYHYFASLDALITALIVDAFNAYADFVRAARDDAAAAGQDHAAQLMAAMRAYRVWAITHRTDFQLIYGNPIPGYAAPEETTVPAASQMGAVFQETLAAALQAGALTLPHTFEDIPPAVRAHYATRFGLDTAQVPVFHLMNQTWALMHGMVVLEVYNHFGPVVGATDAFYTRTLQDYLHGLGLPIG